MYVCTYLSEQFASFYLPHRSCIKFICLAFLFSTYLHLLSSCYCCLFNNSSFLISCLPNLLPLISFHKLSPRYIFSCSLVSLLVRNSNDIRLISRLQAYLFDYWLYVYLSLILLYFESLRAASLRDMRSKELQRIRNYLLQCFASPKMKTERKMKRKSHHNSVLHKI